MSTHMSYREIKAQLKTLHSRYGKNSKSKTLSLGFHVDNLFANLEAALTALEETERDCVMAAELGNQLLEKCRRLEKEIETRDKQLEDKDKAIQAMRLELLEAQEELQSRSKEGSGGESEKSQKEREDQGGRKGGHRRGGADGNVGSMTAAMHEQNLHRRVQSMEVHWNSVVEELTKKDQQVLQLQATVEILKQKQQERESLLEQIDDLNGSIIDLRGENEVLSATVSKLTFEKKQAEEKLVAAEKFQEQAKSLEISLEDCKRKLASEKQLKESAEEQARLLKEKYVDTGDQQARHSLLQQTNQRLTAEIAELKSTLEIERAKVEELQRSQATGLTGNSLGDELLSSKALSAYSEAEIQSLQEHTRSLEAALDSEKKRSAQLQAQLASSTPSPTSSPHLPAAASSSVSSFTCAQCAQVSGTSGGSVSAAEHAALKRNLEELRTTLELERAKYNSLAQHVQSPRSGRNAGEALLASHNHIEVDSSDRRSSCFKMCRCCRCAVM
eukprot:GILI01028270.1.p1 GENE.GILI01028270.1~~GILI01028270.1.p1  ORF type:complete len:502 (-),score=124.05 GILI01028270.1:89-1594(-)